MVRLLPPRDSRTSSTPSPSSVSIPIRPPDVAPTPSRPSTKARPSSSHVNARGPSPVPASTPSPSSVDVQGPSPIPTSTPSPSLLVGNMTTDEDAINLAMEDPLNDRPMVTLINGVLWQRLSLYPLGNNLVSLGLHEERFQKIINNFFSSILRKLVWRPEEENERKKAFNLKASHRLSEMFKDARNENKRPIVFGMIYYHIGIHLSIVPSVHRQKKKNRASEKGGCMHRRSCHSLGVYIKIIIHSCLYLLVLPLNSKELGRSVYVDEVFQQTYLGKDIARSNAASSVGEFQLTPLDPAEEQRHRIAGPKHKGHLYGNGGAHTYKCKNDSSMQQTQGSSSHVKDATEINCLREELRQSKEEMRIFQSIVLQFLPQKA
ncbi:hypothetical protein GmHk_01G001324 [Glycine max]|nr:hypothetical protein GmHk_01G001324 [Glycine max]